CLVAPRPPAPTLFPYTTLFRSATGWARVAAAPRYPAERVARCCCARGRRGPTRGDELLWNRRVGSARRADPACARRQRGPRRHDPRIRLLRHVAAVAARQSHTVQRRGTRLPLPARRRLRSGG